MWPAATGIVGACEMFHQGQLLGADVASVCWGLVAAVGLGVWPGVLSALVAAPHRPAPKRWPTTLKRTRRPRIVICAVDRGVGRHRCANHRQPVEPKPSRLSGNSNQAVEGGRCHGCPGRRRRGVRHRRAPAACCLGADPRDLDHPAQRRPHWLAWGLLHLTSGPVLRLPGSTGGSPGRGRMRNRGLRLAATVNRPKVVGGRSRGRLVANTNSIESRGARTLLLHNTYVFPHVHV